MTQIPWQMEEAVGSLDPLVDLAALEERTLEIPEGLNGGEMDCPLCRRFAERIHSMAFPGCPSTDQIIVLTNAYVIAHHGRFFYTRDRAKWVLRILQRDGCPDMVLYQVANILVDIGGLE